MKSISMEQVQQEEYTPIYTVPGKLSSLFFLLKGVVWVGFSGWVIYIGLF